jgi:4-alpha-glucanotransferase
MYAAPDSSDTWAHRRLFCLDEKGKPLKLAGVPPDYFSAKGQLWGNPLYAWDEMKKENYRWWVERVRRALQMADYLRLDHFRAFEAYWEVPREAKTAVQGYWKKGPGQHFFEVLFQELGELPLIAEDLGFLTPEVKNLKNIFGFPGMKVFQFSPREMLEEGEPGELYYTGTHDNDTLLGWCRKNWKKVIRLLADESGLLQTDSTSRVETEKPAGRHGKADPLVLSCRRIIEKLYLSKAPWVIVPLQDILGLGSEARMNKPGTTRGNWQWQFDRELLDEEKISWLRELAQKSGRI